MPDLSGDISAAVDTAFSAPPGSSPATPDTTETPAAPADASPTTATADASGSEAHSPRSRSTVPPTKQASDAKTATDDQTPVPSKGEPPREKWDTILANARTKQEDEVLQRYGIPKTADANTIRAHVSALIADPVRYYEELGQSLARNGLLKQPTQTPTPPQSTPTADDIEPDYRTEDGNGVYSAKKVQALLERQAASIRADVSKMVNPLQEAHEAAQIQQVIAQAQASAKSQFEEAMTWDGFAELKDQIRDEMQRDGRVTLESAYARLHKEWRKGRDEQLRAETRQTVIAELKKAPLANTATPGATKPTARGQRGPMSLDQRFDDAINAELSKAAVS